MGEVEIAAAAVHERPVLRNLMQLYVHDFSEILAPDRVEGDLGDDGRFIDYPLDAYWSDPDHVPLLIRAGGKLAGFALIDAHGHTGEPVDRNMAEFFVARKHRRGGVGSVAARTIFSRYPGVWEAAIARRNLAALAFWRRAVSGHPDLAEVEEWDMAGGEWNGPVLRFRIHPPA